MTDEVYEKFLTQECDFDSAHDINHIKRVVKNAKQLLIDKDADEQIVLAATWLHDCVILPKNHPDRKKASALAAKKAGTFLAKISFPEGKISQVEHAILSHSFSAGIMPETLEAKIVQDSDRLDALGAIGIARCLMVAGSLNRKLYQEKDPFCDDRTPNDLEYTIDHFYKKLFKLPEMMNTQPARVEANKRVEFMKMYLKELGKEIV